MEKSELEAFKKIIQYEKINLNINFPNGLVNVDAVLFALDKAQKNELAKFVEDKERLMPSSLIIK